MHGMSFCRRDMRSNTGSSCDARLTPTPPFNSAPFLELSHAVVDWLWTGQCAKVFSGRTVACQGFIGPVSRGP